MIKFRVWNELEKRMLYPDVLMFEQDGSFTNVHYIENVKEGDTFSSDKLTIIDDYLTVLMEPALYWYDKPIFESDVLYKDVQGKKVYGEVINSIPGFKVYWNDGTEEFLTESDFIGVAGNKYENPELLDEDID